ncbi:hypothetical protein [Altererythrobacter sp.]|uniref:hypothetical protein n=1 Tax=Altererythrobacter sp. TaxID=1872480 RepID=UPI003D090772
MTTSRQGSNGSWRPGKPGWSDWREFTDFPYMHWLQRLDAEGNPTPGDPDEASEIWRPRWIEEFSEQVRLDREARKFQGEPSSPRIILPIVLPSLLPDVCVNSLPVTKGLRAIVAVIDTDIPLGHLAFRDEDGRSRVLYHYQMNFPPLIEDGGVTFGRGFVKSEIDALLHKYSGGDLHGELDTRGFNTEIGALEMKDPRGNRALLSRHSHGAHVLDVAAGADPASQFAREVGIITVGVPPRWDFGEAGELLDIVMFLAVTQVERVSWKLWSISEKEPPENLEPYGFPTICNLAFGRQAGSKRESGDAFPVILKAIKDEIRRRTNSRPSGPPRVDPPFEIVMPAGNDNLMRVAGYWEIKPKECLDIPWRILPGDQSDNHLELWAEDCAKPGEHEVKLGVAMARLGEPFKAAEIGPLGKYKDVLLDRKEQFAVRIYRLSEIDRIGDDENLRPGYLIATGPSDPRTEGLGAAPAGCFTVRLKNFGDRTISVDAFVRTDQSVLPVAGSSGRSYMDGAKYKTHDARGSGMDSIRWDPIQKKWLSTEDCSGVLRHGTINAGASHGFASTVGGYLLSNGMPAIYSATGAARYGTPGTRSAPTAALPTDNSVVLRGKLAAGARDGTKVALVGTSFASAQATRIVAESWRKLKKGHKGAEDILKTAARDFEDNSKPAYYREVGGCSAQDASFAKFGEGRIQEPAPQRLPREGY